MGRLRHLVLATPLAGAALALHPVIAEMVTGGGDWRQRLSRLDRLLRMVPFLPGGRGFLLAHIRRSIPDETEAQEFGDALAMRYAADRSRALAVADALMAYKFHAEADRILANLKADPQIASRRAACRNALIGRTEATERDGGASPASRPADDRDARRLAEERRYRGDMQGAVELLSAAWRKTGDLSAARDLAKLEFERMNFALALDIASKALSRKPRDAGFLEIRGDCHAHFGHREAAADDYLASLLAHLPRDFPLRIYRNLRGLEQGGELAPRSGGLRSREYQARLAGLMFKSTRSTIALGRTFLEEGHVEEHIRQCRKALKRDPGSPMALHWLAHGLAWHDLESLSSDPERWEEVKRLYRRAMTAAGSGLIWILSDYLRALISHGDHEEIVRVFTKSRALMDDRERRAPLASSMMLCALDVGDFAAAHQAIEALPESMNLRRFSNDLHVPPSTADIAKDARVLFLSEGGVGDEIRFASLYPELVARFPNASFTVEDRLASLFERSFPNVPFIPVARFYRSGLTEANIALARGLPSSALIRYLDGRTYGLANEFETVVPVKWMLASLRPDRARYIAGRKSMLKPDPTRIAAWRGWLVELGTGAKIGLSWGSGIQHYRRRTHYFANSQIAELARALDGSLIDLNYFESADDRAEIERLSGRRIFDPPGLDLRDDFEGTSALIANLDLVIAVNTSVCEQAAALGKPTILCALGLENRWRAIGPEGADAYFPDMTVVAPDQAGDIASVVEKTSALAGAILARTRRS